MFNIPSSASVPGGDKGVPSNTNANDEAEADGGGGGDQTNTSDVKDGVERICAVDTAGNRIMIDVSVLTKATKTVVLEKKIEFRNEDYDLRTDGYIEVEMVEEEDLNSINGNEQNSRVDCSLKPKSRLVILEEDLKSLFKVPEIPKNYSAGGDHQEQSGLMAVAVYDIVDEEPHYEFPSGFPPFPCVNSITEAELENLANILNPRVHNLTRLIPRTFDDLHANPRPSRQVDNFIDMQVQRALRAKHRRHNEKKRIEKEKRMALEAKAKKIRERFENKENKKFVAKNKIVAKYAKRNQGGKRKLKAPATGRNGPQVTKSLKKKTLAYSPRCKHAFTRKYATSLQKWVQSGFSNLKKRGRKNYGVRETTEIATFPVGSLVYVTKESKDGVDLECFPAVVISRGYESKVDPIARVLAQSTQKPSPMSPQSTPEPSPVAEAFELGTQFWKENIVEEGQPLPHEDKTPDVKPGPSNLEARSLTETTDLKPPSSRLRPGIRSSAESVAKPGPSKQGAGIKFQYKATAIFPGLEVDSKRKADEFDDARYVTDCLVRSFEDDNYHLVSLSSLRKFRPVPDSDSYCDLYALVNAMIYYEQGNLPKSWCEDYLVLSDNMEEKKQEVEMDPME